jgi:voltage-gated potassium channel
MIERTRQYVRSMTGARSREATLRRNLLAAALVFMVFVLVSTAGYKILLPPEEGWLSALYMTIITVATVGYREVGGTMGPAGQAWTIFVVAGGITTGAVAMSLIVAAIVEGSIRGVFGRRQLERRINALSGHVIVCGYGRTGRQIAQDLTQAGRHVVIVDVDPERTALAEADDVLYVLGDAQEEALLESAGIERAVAVIAVLPNDAGNVYLTLSARGLNASLRIIARAQEASTQDKLLKAGATRVVCPTTIGANRIADVLLRPAMVDFVDVAHKGVDLEMDQFTVAPDSAMVGKSLRELALPSRAGATVVAVRKPDATAVYNPGPETILDGGDTIILIGKRGMAGNLQKIAGLTEAPEGSAGAAIE